MIGRIHSTVLDCPDPIALARFYAEVTGLPVHVNDPDWASIGHDGQWQLAFQQVEGYTPPQWPGQEVPQQFHLDIEIDDIEAAEPALLALGATKLPGGGKDFRVYADPAGHPFCLVWNL
jgi:catechol 2,3-dioxygenase-like lactoylglutathione lyase family enzyme